MYDCVFLVLLLYRNQLAKEKYIYIYIFFFCFKVVGCPFSMS